MVLDKSKSNKKNEEPKVEVQVQSTIIIEDNGDVTVKKDIKKTTKMQKTYYLDEEVIKGIEELATMTGKNASEVIAFCVTSTKKRIRVIEE